MRRIHFFPSLCTQCLDHNYTDVLFPSEGKLKLQHYLNTVTALSFHKQLALALAIYE